MATSEDTKSYTLTHIKNVREKLEYFSEILRQRGEYHDKSKLEEPEITGWIAMDKESHQAYGSTAYFEKMARFRDLFVHHYAINSHHPEHFRDAEHEMNLIDVIEMFCDWFSYKKNFTLYEAYNLIEEQCTRFKFGDTMKSLLKNTFSSFFNCDLDFVSQEKIVADVILRRSKDYEKWQRIASHDDKTEYIDFEMPEVDFSKYFNDEGDFIDG